MSRSRRRHALLEAEDPPQTGLRPHDRSAALCAQQIKIDGSKNSDVMCDSGSAQLALEWGLTMRWNRNVRKLACGVLALVCLVGGSLTASTAVADALDIYFIDVEGGQSTLIVTPDKHSLLIDTGWAGQGSGFSPGDPHQARDANRIVAAARDAGIARIDFLLITHFHPDHDGGVPELAKLMPIGTFIDHERPSRWAKFTSPDIEPAFAAYRALREGHTHIVPKPGDRLPIPGLEAIVVSSAARILTSPLPGAGKPNPLCSGKPVAAADPFENPGSTGILLQFGSFRFLDVGDLSGGPLRRLACPRSLIGPVDVYLVAHHGGRDASDPATFAAFSPTVAVMNNGVNKGGGAATFRSLHQVVGLKDVWQLHASSNEGAENFAPAFIANLDEGSSHWIKLQAQADGSFRIHNPRTDAWMSYPARDSMAGSSNRVAIHPLALTD
jgi:competence protein ComEC